MNSTAEQLVSMPPLDQAEIPTERRIFCNRTINLRSIGAIGFDMDYTLIHYRPEVWESAAYDHMKQRLLDLGWPVENLMFDPEAAVLGLIVDLDHGTIVKANRFGFIKQAVHGLRELSFEELRDLYGRVLVDLNEPRWVFLNTFFSLSEGCMFSQLVDLLDKGQLEKGMSYARLYNCVKASLDEAHMEGTLKAEIMADPERYVVLDPDTPLALLDLKNAGKKLVLITNSEWAYTRVMMRYAFDAYLPGDMTWRDLFDLKIVSARKPAFFTQRSPAFQVINEEGHLCPTGTRLQEREIYVGGHAGMVEELFSLSGEELLYVGDHIFADVNMSKSLLRWRTALVLRALEDEVLALEGFKSKQEELRRLMAEKEVLETRRGQARLRVLRHRSGLGPRPVEEVEKLEQEVARIRDALMALDRSIQPLASEAARLSHPRWGLLLRTGNDKSHLARQVERYADVYTSRVSNLVLHTPYAYLRAHGGSLPHEA